MKQIKLLSSDFDSLSHDVFLQSDQFSSNRDCPIARAIKRIANDPESVWVCTFSVEFDKTSICIEGNYNEVDRCRESLENGSKFAIIKVTK